MYFGWTVRRLTDYAALLEVYSLQDLLELNDKTEEDLLIFLIEEGYLSLPTIQPLEFDD